MKLSVLMITYNHERYLRQALDGALAQDVDFDYEIVVGEDRSTDGTRGVLLEYRDKHPDKIRLLLRENNLGPVRNFWNTLEACRGQYVALLEGDDYWTSPLKLRKQVELLDAHPEYAICFHDVLSHHEDGSKEDLNYVRADQPETLRLQDLLVENIIPTCSAVFRNGLIGPVPQWLFDLRMGDYPLHVFNAQHGDIAYLNEVMGVYRVHPAGIYSRLDWEQRLLAIIRLFEYFARYLDPKYRKEVRLRLAYKYWQLAAEYESRGELALARAYALRSLRTKAWTPSLRVRHKVKVLARTSLPKTYGAVAKVAHGFRSQTPAAATPPRPAHPKPRVSVVIPVYNAQRYLLDAVESTLAQSFDDFECILVDDGSTDRSGSILQDLARRDGRVKPIRIPHGGIVEALNAGLRHSTAPYVARMDADDLCLPDRFEKQVRYLDDNPDCVAVGTKVLLTDPYGSPLWDIDVKTTHGEIEAELLRGNGWAIFHPSVMMRREAIEKAGPYRPEYQWSEDIDLFLRLAEVGRLANLPTVLLRYRQHFTSVNRTRTELQVRRSQRLLAEAYRRRGRALPEGFRLDPPPHLGPYEQMRAWARRAIINKNWGVACRHAFAAVRTRPLKYEGWNLMFHAMARR